MSPEATDGRRQTKAELEGGASGLMGHGGDEGARSLAGAAGSTGRGGVWDSEAGGRDKGSSRHSHRRKRQGNDLHSRFKNSANDEVIFNS